MDPAVLALAAAMAGQPDLRVRPESALPQTVDVRPAPPPTTSRTWTTADKAREGAFAALVLADWAQTRSSLGEDGLKERNPLLGKNPSPAKLAGLSALGAVGHAGVTHLLPKPWRDIWLNTTLAAEGLNVANNHLNGARINVRRLF